MRYKVKKLRGIVLVFLLGTLHALVSGGEAKHCIRKSNKEQNALMDHHFAQMRVSQAAQKNAMLELTKPGFAPYEVFIRRLGDRNKLADSTLYATNAPNVFEAYAMGVGYDVSDFALYYLCWVSGVCDDDNLFRKRQENAERVIYWARKKQLLCDKTGAVAGREIDD